MQINLFVNVVLATGEGTGAVSCLNYAFRLMYLPIGLFGVSIATAVLPEAARHAAREDRAAISDTVKRGQIIGYNGLTGLTTGPHVHFEVRVGGEFKNPRQYLPK